MLASPTPDPGALPTGRGWAYEVKWDGMRVLADSRDAAGPAASRLRLRSRTGADVTDTFPELAPLADLPDALLDGEVVAFDDDGRPDFAVLAPRLHVTRRGRARVAAATTPVTYLVFDVLRLYGVDLTARRLRERRATLERLELPEGPLRRSPLYTDGQALLTATAEQGLEGVVAKRLDSVYEPGRRSRSWVKHAHRDERTVVVGGWRPQAGTTRTVGALLVGAPDPTGALRYLGRVGAGIGPAAHTDLSRLLEVLRATESPFAEPVPRADATGARWCVPTLAVQVRHLGWTSGHRLRQPSYRGVRLDAPADPVAVP